MSVENSRSLLNDLWHSLADTGERLTELVADIGRWMDDTEPEPEPMTPLGEHLWAVRSTRSKERIA